ncbi:MAG: zinc metallopeptidase, partial [Pirellulales bacterium]|nr:zinc metallopeptidase [Pirellulales bacterium]
MRSLTTAAPTAAVLADRKSFYPFEVGKTMIFDPMYLLFIGPALLLGLYAQWKVKSTFHQMSEMPARMTGSQAARQMLDSEGLYDVG